MSNEKSKATMSAENKYRKHGLNWIGEVESNYPIALSHGSTDEEKESNARLIVNALNRKDTLESKLSESQQSNAELLARVEEFRDKMNKEWNKNGMGSGISYSSLVGQLDQLLSEHKPTEEKED